MVAVLAALAVVLVFGMPMSVSAAEPLGRVAFTTGEIVVFGRTIDAPRPSVTSGVITLPLRPIAEALGLTVAWDEEEQRIDVGDNYVLWIGRDVISRDGGQTIEQFGPPPQIIDDFAYVPISFFNYGLAGFSAEIFDGVVIVSMTIGGSMEIVWGGNETFTLGTWFDEAQGADFIARYDERNVLRLGSGLFSVLRVAIGTEFFADEVKAARLFLRTVEPADEPPSIVIAPMNEVWASNLTTQGEALTMIDNAAAFTPNVRDEGDGWFGYDITELVRMWLCGEIHHNGIAITGGPAEFYFSEGNFPFIKAVGVVGERPAGHAAFGFTRFPDEADIDRYDTGNCLAFALRDGNMINLDHLAGSYEVGYAEINRLYHSEGINAVLEYMVKLIEAYVEANAEALQISGFRRIDSHNAPIDAETEYRIALRVGSDAPPGVDITPDGGFDFHLWAQIDDGRWAQKFSGGFSEIVVGSGADVDPITLPWHGVLDDLWGMLVRMNYYNSGIAYFAVTKDTSDFTFHLGEGRVPNGPL